MTANMRFFSGGYILIEKRSNEALTLPAVNANCTVIRERRNAVSEREMALLAREAG